MPWTAKDADKHKKGLSPKQKKQWASTANAALARCEAGNVKPQGGASCEAYAIKTANAVAGAKRDWSFEERSSIIRMAFSAKFNTPDGAYMYADMIFDDYLVTRISGRIYRVDYTFSDGEVTFAERNDWVEVEHEFKEVASRTVSVPIRAVKDKPGHYKAYAVVFNTPSDRDLYGTYFDADTDYRMEYYPEWPWLYHHTMNPHYGHRMVGTWSERGIDDVGVFVEGEITAHGAYREAVEWLIDKEVLFTSSQAVHSGVRVANDGHVEVWPICEVSSTISPGDWRMQKPIGPDTVRAINVLETDEDEGGGDEMSWKDKLVRFIEGLPDTGATEPVQPDPAQPDPAQSDSRSADGKPIDDKGNVTFDLKAVVEQVVEMVDLEPVVRAVTALDNTMRAVDKRLEDLEGIVGGLAKTEPERLKDMLSGGDWFSKLFVASRSGEEVPPDDAKDIKDKDGGTPLKEGETVFGRIASGPPSAGG